MEIMRRTIWVVPETLCDDLSQPGPWEQYDDFRTAGQDSSRPRDRQTDRHKYRLPHHHPMFFPAAGSPDCRLHPGERRKVLAEDMGPDRPGMGPVAGCSIPSAGRAGSMVAAPVTDSLRYCTAGCTVAKGCHIAAAASRLGRCHYRPHHRRRTQASVRLEAAASRTPVADRTWTWR